jgi:hypothetical protein
MPRKRNHSAFDINNPPAYCEMPVWRLSTGMSKNKTYKYIPLKKLDSRTLVDVRKGLEWMERLPEVQSKNRSQSRSE